MKKMSLMDWLYSDCREFDRVIADKTTPRWKRRKANIKKSYVISTLKAYSRYRGGSDGRRSKT